MDAGEGIGTPETEPAEEKTGALVAVDVAWTNVIAVDDDIGKEFTAGWKVGAATFSGGSATV